MLILAMLFWIGYIMVAPAWFWWCWGISAFITFVRFAWSMYKAGSEK